jgi:UDP-4-amino-4-deoxy-L-arabinose formyltransferase/UDP-glucuronic acid dehydrogenase (UDP-4-keto-hexauronic acid decarboxylating)
LRVVVLGYHDVGCACLEVLLEERHDVAAVFTHEDDPGEERWFGSVEDLARRRGIPVHLPRRINERRWIDTIRSLAPDAILSCYYRRLVCGAITGLARRAALNVHGSLLPRYRGRCPLNWVLANGETETGVTLHHMTDRPDAGDVVAQRAIAITPEDTAPTLHRKIVAASRDLLRATLPDLERGDLRGVPQDEARATCHGPRRPGDGRIDWTRPATEIHNLVRAVTRPWPGAFTHLDGHKLYVWRSAPEPTRHDAPAGTFFPDGKPRVVTGGGCLRLLECQLEGEAPIPGEALAARFARGTAA